MITYLEGKNAEESEAIYFRDPIGFMLRAYEKAGPIFKTRLRGMDLPVLAGKEANVFVWQNSHLWKYRESHRGFGEEIGMDHVSVKDGPEHAVRRSLLKPGFDHKAAMQTLHTSNQLIFEYAKNLEEGKRFVVNDLWAHWIMRLQARVHLGISLDDSTVAKLSKWEKQLIRGFVKMEGRHAYYDRDEYRELKGHGLDLYRRIAEDKLGEAAASTDDTLLSQIISKRKAEGCLTVEGVANDIYFLLSAGVHNTANFVTWLLIYIYWNPIWLKRLRSELDHWDPLDGRGLSDCETLKAIVMEVQRIRPTTFGHIRHVSESFEFMGEKIEADARINHANTLCQFLSEFYEDPFRFSPERFLDGGRFVSRTLGFYGGGTHICLGRHHSNFQQLYIVAQIVRLWDFEADFEPDFHVSLIGTGTQHEREMAGWFRPREDS